MKICIPVESKSGMDSVVYGHFGSAPHFVIYDFTNNSSLEIDNINLHHEHGQCNPLKNFANIEFKAMVTGGIGQGALLKLMTQGIEVYKTTVEERVSDVIESYKAGGLIKLTAEHSCQHHNCH